ncbi:hypothetical protein HBI56_202730 [Parastagonospora nodorum]|uniref:Uncharacterized protein n=1 Tax=Phaeosphaeria nodorum (strain SN15 / ATCC MYA-4574 / FGSC 10173) TaxID=321614 RepID=A0A7U2FA24_PHANO|nr:hypothetical protein HBH56_143370 [Parastagonospora nodorum]QRD01493.1 hypothetical protein JI435_416780 [Parastagonospora nodorum SN15]KAH3927682.1 hypothetical protein HBH54_148560 [Parastagonospora nodorum]KAH3962072.1 hypothetical protein HBH51_178450 [Parastagonospora nodorum]KAH3970918.1 hypothetical protein HBH52_162940 [Parastagonospora nodorum]
MGNAGNTNLTSCLLSSALALTWYSFFAPMDLYSLLALRASDDLAGVLSCVSFWGLLSGPSSFLQCMK